MSNEEILEIGDDGSFDIPTPQPRLEQPVIIITEPVAFNSTLNNASNYFNDLSPGEYKVSSH